MSTPTHAERHGQTTISVQEADQLEIAPGTARAGVEGWVPDLATEEDLRAALETAFDYRGDVTISRKDGSKIDGYIFDRVAGTNLSSSFVRILLRDSNDRVKVAYSDIAGLAFSGRDTAAGKSWEAWVRKFWEKKAAGESGIAITPESLEE